MKKIFIVIFVLIASYGYAQDLKFGAKAGLNFATIVGDDIENADMKTGVYFGGFLNTPLSDRLSFQPELLYSTQGVKTDFENIDIKYKFSYINIPLLLKMNLDAKKSINVYAGPQLGFLVKSEIEGEQGGSSLTEDFKDQTNNFDFSFNIGFSVDVNENFAIDLRYNRGLSKVLDIEGMDDIKSYNSMIQLGAAYTF